MPASGAGAARSKPPPRVRRSWILVALLLALAVSLHLAAEAVAQRAETPFPLTPSLRFHPARAHLFSPDAIPFDELGRDRLPLRYTLRPGETLVSVLESLGVERPQGHWAARAASEVTDLRKLRAGDAYMAFFRQDSLSALHLSVRDEGRLELVRQGSDWRAEMRPYLRSTELAAVRGTLDGLLEEAIRRSGGEPVLAYAMADVLQWDLDFNRDLQLGDSFEVLYERVFLDRSYHDIGQVLALRYANAGRMLTAYQFGEADDYYDRDGRPLRKMFLRSPLRYSRVTSGFSKRRFHPVLKTYRPHYGVDYGAPTGTPVRVTASGVVVSAGWEGGGGRMVRVRHTNGYLTAYLHLSGFADGIRSGARVRQGDVVGYVGATGLATAPHLDYRVQLAGRWIDPLSLPNEPAPPIPDDELPLFRAWRDALDASLDAGEPRPEVLIAARPGGDRSPALR